MKVAKIEIVNAVQDALQKHARREWRHANDLIFDVLLYHDIEIDGSQLRAAVHQLRMVGIPIASGMLGYKLVANNSRVIRKTISNLKGRAKEILAVAEALERGIGQ